MNWNSSLAVLALLAATVMGTANALAAAYGRVDLVRDDHGNLAVMELELIEPELWLRNHPFAANAFADAIAKIVLA